MTFNLQQILMDVERKQISKHDAYAMIAKYKNKQQNGNPYFSRTFQYNEPYLRDHTVFEEQVLLGVTHCSLAIEAIQHRGHSLPIVLNKVLFHHPVVIQSGEFVDVKVEIKELEGKTFFNHKYKKEHTDQFIELASGEVSGRSEDQTAGSRIDFTKFEKPDLVLTSAEIYDRLARTPVKHGPSLHTVRHVYVKGNETLGELELTAEIINQTYSYQIHPALLDGAVVSSMCGMKTELKDSYIPLMVKRIAIFGAVPQKVLCYSKIVKVNSEVLVTDMYLCNEHGDVIVHLDGFTCKSVRSSEQLNPTKAKDEVSFTTNDSSKIANSNLDVENIQVNSPSLQSESMEEEVGSDRGEVLSQKIGGYLEEKIRSALPNYDIKKDKDKNFMDIGIDSTSLIEMAKMIEKELDIELYPTLFFEHQNTVELIRYFIEEHQERLLEFFDLVQENQEVMIAPVNKTVSSSSDQIMKDISSDSKHVQESTPAVAKEAIENVVEQESTDHKVEVERQANRSQDIAIIGMAGQFAGSSNLNEFWDNLRDKKDLMKEIPIDHFDYRPWYDPIPQAPDKMYSKWGSFIEDVDKFDADFFNISPREAKMMDPQLRLLLQVLYSTVEDAGYPKKIRGTKTGMYVGACFQDYKDRLSQEVDPHSGTGNAATMLANRPSFYFNILGPSLLVDTACSSSLVALHLACKALRDNECDMAFVAGTNLLLSSFHYRYFCSIGALTHTGRCHSFDEAADGYAPGEGVAAVLLKPLEKAIKDGDQIHAVIKGSAINHGGYTPSITAPSMKQEAKVILDAWEDSKIDPSTIGYIEAHGTGTKLGDPVEINALKEAFKKANAMDASCAVGSAKAHIGHTEGTAGIAGLIKVVLSLKNKHIPAMPMFKKLNSYIKLEGSPLYINKELQAWESRPNIPRRAGISSFGFGGANAHVVVEEFESDHVNKNVYLNESSAQIMILSAKNKERLRQKASELERFIARKADSLRLIDIAYTLQTGREEMEERLAFVVSNLGELQQNLNDFLNDSIHKEKLYCGNAEESGTMNQLLHGKTGQDIINQVIKSKDFEKIAQVWVSGADIPWHLLYEHQKGRIISLPTYSFAKKRYWVEENIVEQQNLTLRPSTSTGEKALADSHKRELGLTEQKSSYEIKVNREDAIVRDHQIYQNKVLPGVGYMEMVLNVAKQIIPNEEHIILTDLVWLQPLILEEFEQEIQVKVHQEQQRFTFEILSKKEGGEIIHAKGNFMVDNAASYEEKRISIFEIMDQATQEIEHDVIYQGFNQLGLYYGPYFRSIQHMWVNEKESISKLTMPSGFESELEKYSLHPSLMDGALQSIVGLASQYDQNDRQPMLPFSVDKILKRKALEQESYAYIKQSGLDKYEVYILDAHGNICVEFSGLFIRRVKDSLEDFFYLPIWKQEDIAYESDGQSEHRNLLIISPEESWDLVNEIKESYQQCEIRSIQLSDYTSHDQENELKINYKDQAAWEQIMSNMSDVDTIYFLGGIETKLDVEDDLDRFHDSQEKGVFSLFRLVQSMNKSGLSDQSIRLKVVTNEVYSIKDATKIKPFSSSLIGFTKSLAKEYLHWKVSCLDIHVPNKGESFKREMRQIARMVVNERADQKGNEVVLRHGKRYIRTLEPIKIPSITETPYKEQGVYLIVGGAGGIGLELSRYLAMTVKAKIVLMGRRELNDSQKSKIDSIKKLGSEVLYIQTDLTNYESIEKAITKVKSNFGAINGVFHSALVLKDKTIRNMDESTLRDVLNPKVVGSVNLYKALKKESLDFMVFFSSVQSFFGNPGQSNYAAACSFKDSFAQYLNSQMPYPVKTINWGYWGSVGVVAGDEYNKLMEERGLKSILPEEGMEAIKRVLSSPISQVMTFKAEKNVLKLVGVQEENESLFNQSGLQASPKNILAKDRQPMITDDSFRDQSEIALRELEDFGAKLLTHVFQKIGLFHGEYLEYDQRLLMESLHIIPEYSRLFDAILKILQRVGYIQYQEGIVKWLKREYVDLESDWLRLNTLKEELIEKYPDIASQLTLLWTCFEQYPEILVGQEKATTVMFPDSSMELVEGIYKGNKKVNYFNDLVVWSLQEYLNYRLPLLNRNECLKILEVGAGTGGTSVSILEGIKEFQGKLLYTYTDVSSAFTIYGERTYGQKYPFVDFRTLDVEQDIESQGFRRGDYDIVIGANVLHATKNISHTLQNIKALLKKDGWLVINEATESIDFLTLTFGLLEGWWLYQDDEWRIENSPLLNKKMWRQLLKAEGFDELVTLGEGDSEKGDLGQHVIVAKSNGLIRRKKSVNIEKVPQVPMLTESNKVQHEGNKPIYEDQLEIQKEELVFMIEKEIVRHVRDILNLDENDIKMEKQFMEYGVDSILGLELIKKINESLGINIRTTTLYDYSNIRILSQYLVEEYRMEIQNSYLITQVKQEVAPTMHQIKEANVAQDVIYEGQVEAHIKEQVSLYLKEILNLGEMEVVREEKQFMEYGVDSILGLELIKRVNEAFNITLKTTVLFDYVNVHQFSKYLFNEYGQQIAKQMRKKIQPVINNQMISKQDVQLEDNTELAMLEKLAKGQLSSEEVFKMMGV